MRALIASFVLVGSAISAQEPGAPDTLASSLSQLVQGLPKDSTFASTGQAYGLLKGQFGVKQTTPPSASADVVVQYLTPSGNEAVMNLRMDFTHQDGQWQFIRLVDTASGKDLTALPIGKDILEGGALQRYLAQFRRKASGQR